MDAMESKMAEWKKRMPSKRQLTSAVGQFVQQKSVAVLYTPQEQDRIKRMTDLIAKATSAYDSDEDWERILKVVDALSNASNKHVLKESIRYLRLRLGDPSARTVILALTLTEAVVKNCGPLVHAEIATESFMTELEDLHRSHCNKRGRDSMEITSRVADMVQDWGEAFLPQKYQFPWFIYPYHRMRRRGVKFPKQYDETKVPVITPPRKTDRSRSNSATSSSSKPMASVSSSSSALSGLSPKELYRVALNVSEMFEDMLYEVQKSSAGIGSHGVIVELASQAGELVQRLESIIQRAVANDDPDLANYLSVNDTLNAAIKKFEALPVDNQSSERRSSVSSAKGGRSSNLLDFDDDNQQDNDNRASASRNNQDEDDDDPFADFVRARVQGPTTTSAAPAKASSSTPQVNKDEDDPFADFVQYRAGTTQQQDDLLLTETKPAAPVAKDLIDLWDDVPLQPQQQQTAPKPVQPADPWSLLDPFSSAPTPAPTAPSMAFPAAQPQQQKSVDDDLWNFSSAASITPPQPQYQQQPAAKKDPFDLLALDAFGPSSTSFAAPTAQPAQSAYPVPMQPAAQAPAESFNPFDF